MFMEAPQWNELMHERDRFLCVTFLLRTFQ